MNYIYQLYGAEVDIQLLYDFIHKHLDVNNWLGSLVIACGKDPEHYTGHILRSREHGWFATYVVEDSCFPHKKPSAFDIVIETLHLNISCEWVVKDENAEYFAKSRGNRYLTIN